MNFDIEINSITIPQKQLNQHIVNLIDQLLFIDETFYPRETKNPKESA